MLTAEFAAELRTFDLSGMSSCLQVMTLREDRHRREAESIGIGTDFRRASQAVVQAEANALALADMDRLVFACRRFVAEAQQRPSAPVLPFVPKVVPDPVAPAIRRGPLNRIMAALGRPTAKVA